MQTCDQTPGAAVSDDMLTKHDKLTAIGVFRGISSTRYPQMVTYGLALRGGIVEGRMMADTAYITPRQQPWLETGPSCCCNRKTCHNMAGGKFSYTHSLGREKAGTEKSVWLANKLCQYILGIRKMRTFVRIMANALHLIFGMANQQNSSKLQHFHKGQSCS